MDECEDYEGQTLTPQQIRQMLAKKYWNFEKIEQWVESLPQVQEMRRLEKQGEHSTSNSRLHNPHPIHFEEEED